MRIFHLVPNMNYGGLQEVVKGMALCQREAGHTVTIGCWTNAGNHPEAENELERAGVRVIYLRRSVNGSLSYGRLGAFRKIKSYMGAKNTDILHVHNPFGYYIYGAIAARLARTTKVVNTMHATVMLKNKHFDRKSFRAAAMLSDEIVSVCSEVKTVLGQEFSFSSRKLSVVENGIDLATFLKVPARMQRDSVVFGAVGRMSKEKNHRVLIEAFAPVRRNYPAARLRFLGGGPLEPALKDLVRDLNLGEAVEFCGFSNDVAGFLSGLDVFVLPSNSEGLPLSLLEAIASGLPVVATAVGGVPQVVQSTDSGWLCEPENAASLQKALESAILDAERAHRGERARQIVAQRYSAERMTRDYEEVYRRLLR